MKMFFRLALSLALILNTLAPSFGQAFEVGEHVWEYNPGPDPETELGRKIIDIFAEQPFYGGFSEELMDEQKFRYIFGLMMTRTYFEKNSTKIMFWGQDATHIAEASKQPGTSGFGGRVQDIANYFGVDQGVTTSNAFLSTIKGQFGAFDHLFVKTADDGTKSLVTDKYIDNELWMIANDPDSEIRIQREKFFETMIMNNPESLGMIAVFGDAAKHAFAQFLIARGAEVPTKTTEEELKKFGVPETKLVNAGGNAEFAVPIDKNGKDIYQILADEDAKKNGRKPTKLDYSKSVADPKNPRKMILVDQLRAIKLAKDAGQRAIDMMILTEGGMHKSGMMNPAQKGGYDFTRVKINGQVTNSLKGLKLLYYNHIIDRHIAFVESPHPTALSQMAADVAASTLKKAFSVLESLKALGWKIEPDLANDGTLRQNRWHDGLPYKYGRADIRAGFFEFGAPTDRRASSADATRLNPQSIIIGSRQKVSFDRQTLMNMERAMPSDMPNPEDLWSVRPRNLKQRYEFDRGPGKDVAKALMTALENSREQIFAIKDGNFEKKTDTRGNDVTFEYYGIGAYYAKTVAETGFFGMHRGSFKDARVVILADPHGIDDWNTSRALTGARGQYLNGMMNDLGIGKDYLVIKTAPVGMDGATAEEWEHVRKHTEAYREAALKEALKNEAVEFVMADGPIAQKEMKRILKKMKRTDIEVIDINREGMDPKSGILEAGQSVKELGDAYKASQISGLMKDIPRGHLPWWSRTWEGTSGDLVIDASGKASGKVRAIVTPDWVVNQKVHQTEREKVSIAKLLKKMKDAGFKVGSETLATYFERAAKRLKKMLGTPERMGKTVLAAKDRRESAPFKARMCSQFYKKTP